MGGAVSSPVHLRIYNNILRIQNPQTRVSMLETLLAGPEYVIAAKDAGVYGAVLAYIHAVKNGNYSVVLPGEAPVPAPAKGLFQTITHYTDKINPWKQVVKKPAEKVLTYFNSCLEILELDEHDVLTEEKLKAAYKRASVKAHPDKKGGSEEKFQAIGRAYNYLMELLKRIHGGGERPELKETRALTNRMADPGPVPVPAPEDKWEKIAPVTLNPKKLDMNTFNSVFEQIKEASGEEADDGYENWLKNKETHSAAQQQFNGSFSADKFNAVFLESQQGRRQAKQDENMFAHPAMMAMNLAPDLGTSLVNNGTNDYTAPANSELQYSDLKRAYTVDATITDKVADVVITERNLEQYKAERKKAPVLNDYEKQQLEAQELKMKNMDMYLTRMRDEQTRKENDFAARLNNLVKTQ